MLRFFQNSNPLMFLLYILIGGLIAFAIPDKIVTEIDFQNQTFLYKKIILLIQGQYFILLYKVIIAILLILNAYVFNRLILSIKLFKSNNIYHGFIYLMLIGLAVVSEDSLIIIIVSLLLLFTLHIIFNTIRKTIAILDFLNAGLLLSLAFLFWEITAYLFPIIFVSLLILRIQNWREWLAGLIGLFIPIFIFTSFYFFIYSNFDVVFDYYLLFLKNSNSINFSTPQYIMGGFILILSLISSFKIIGRFNSLESSKQDFYKLFFFFCVNTIIILIFIPNIFFNIYIFGMIAFSIPFSMFFISIRNKIISEFTFDAFLLLCIIAIESISF